MFEFLEPRFELVRYIARQSLISAYSQPATALPVPDLASNFQRTMLTNDFRSSLRAELEECVGDVDLVLWDLTDERLGVLELPGGAFVTRSVEMLQNPGAVPLPAETRCVPWGTKTHKALWRRALSQFVEDLSRLGMANKTRLLNVPWATRDAEGRPAPQSFGLDARRANKVMGWYARTASKRLRPEQLLVPSHDVPILADPQHKWGLAPFHYSPEVYSDLAKQVAASPPR